MKLEVKYIFPTSTPGVNNYTHKLPEVLGMRRILVHATRIQKNPQTGRIFSGFSQIFVELCGSKVQLTPPDRNFINGITNPEIVC